MSTLNRAAGEAMVRAAARVHAATDVTGFGLLGHLSEMLGAGGVGVRVEADAVPVLEEAWDFVRQDVVPGGTRRNLASVEPLHGLVRAPRRTTSDWCWPTRRPPAAC